MNADLVVGWGSECRFSGWEGMTADLVAGVEWSECRLKWLGGGVSADLVAGGWGGVE